MRTNVPVTMATQHPDNAGKPYWHHDPFVSTNSEPQECYLMYSDLGAHEYNWDWEGKFVDEALFEKLIGEHFEFFTEKQIGRDVFLTIRLPNPDTVTDFRLGRALMSIIGASGLAQKVDVNSPPLFEVILPMIENHKQMLDVQEAFQEISGLKHWLFEINSHSIDHLAIIPLFEQVDVIMDSDQIIERYLAAHEQKFKFLPDHLRPYIARSDPALNAGMVPTVLAIKIALSRYRQLEQKLELPMYPMLGCASLPFRGGLTPRTHQEFMEIYAGLRTLVIQSAFRYDYPKDEVKKSIAEINQQLPQTEARLFDKEEEKTARELVKLFTDPYRQTIEGIANRVNQVAASVPKRRERVQHIGLFGYSRGIGKVKLPRAIKFTASLYSLGVPPEIIGTGRGLKLAQEQGTLDALLNFYPKINSQFSQVLGFVNENNLEKLVQTDPGFAEVKEDLAAITSILGLPAGPQTDEQREHQQVTTELLQALEQEKEISQLVERGAALRKSMG